jgi:hypothetical protein
MKLTLITYESIVAHNAGYAMNIGAVEFSKALYGLANDFAGATGVDIGKVEWEHVADSDWCKNMVVLWAKVPVDWQPTPETTVLGDSYDPSWFPNLSNSLYGWIEGRGKFVDINDRPAKNPHNLYRTKNIGK